MDSGAGASTSKLASAEADEAPLSTVLETLDKAKTQGYHFVTVVIAGMGFFADAYDLFVIGLLTKLLGRIYYQELPTGENAVSVGTLPINVNAAVSSVALCGTLVGQLLFGHLGDRFGRKRVYGITLLLMIGSSVGSALSFGSTTDAVIGTLCFWRFLLGIGVGGDYPLSAVIMSEYSSRSNRGAFVAAVFAMQGVGILTAAAVVLAVASLFRAFHDDVPFGSGDASDIDNIRASCPAATDMAWRVVLVAGAVPAAATMYFRMKMPETARYTGHVMKDKIQATKDMEKVLNTTFTVPEEDDREIAPLQPPSHVHDAQQPTSQEDKKNTLRVRLVTPEDLDEPAKKPTDDGNDLTFSQFLQRYGLRLFGCCSTWFLLDIAFYSQNLFQKDVFSALQWIPHANTMSAFEEMFVIARAQALIALASTIPGYWLTVLTIERMGRWKIQMMGFFMMTLSMVLLTAFYDTLITDHVNWFVTLYATTFFFANWGPNATTFVIPAEVFPTKWRSTGHGIAAAAGKVGAIIGAFGFLYASQDQDSAVAAPYPAGIGLKNSLLSLAVVNFVGMLCTFLVPETRNRSLEELAQ